MSRLFSSWTLKYLYLFNIDEALHQGAMARKSCSKYVLTHIYFCIIVFFFPGCSERIKEDLLRFIKTRLIEYYVTTNKGWFWVNFLNGLKTSFLFFFVIFFYSNNDGPKKMLIPWNFDPIQFYCWHPKNDDPRNCWPPNILYSNLLSPDNCWPQ